MQKEIMTKAHKIAKKIVETVGDYMIALSIALKKVWAEVKKGANKMMEFAEGVSNTIKQDIENYELALFTGSKRQPAWVAEINGLHERFGLDRQFINADKDGGRVDIWELEEGIFYNYQEENEQHFVKIENGILDEYTKEEVMEFYA